jgi:hypothetical protein
MLVGVFTGALRWLRPELKDLTVCTMKDPEYQPFFGLTEREMNGIFLGASFNTRAIKDYYNGYVVPFRNKDGQLAPLSLFNPWSIVNVPKTGKLKFDRKEIPFTMVLESIMERLRVFPKMIDTILGDRIEGVDLQCDISYSNLDSAEPNQIFALMFYAGFLTFDETFSFLQVTNEEIKRVMFPTLQEKFRPRVIHSVNVYQY